MAGVGGCRGEEAGVGGGHGEAGELGDGKGFPPEEAAEALIEGPHRSHDLGGAVFLGELGETLAADPTEVGIGSAGVAPIVAPVGIADGVLHEAGADRFVGESPPFHLHQLADVRAEGPEAAVLADEPVFGPGPTGVGVPGAAQRRGDGDKEGGQLAQEAQRFPGRRGPPHTEGETDMGALVVHFGLPGRPAVLIFDFHELPLFRGQPPQHRLGVVVPAPRRAGRFQRGGPRRPQLVLDDQKELARLGGGRLVFPPEGRELFGGHPGLGRPHQEAAGGRRLPALGDQAAEGALPPHAEDVEERRRAEEELGGGGRDLGVDAGQFPDKVSGPFLEEGPPFPLGGGHPPFAGARGGDRGLARGEDGGGGAGGAHPKCPPRPGKVVFEGPRKLAAEGGNEPRSVEKPPPVFAHTPGVGRGEGERRRQRAGPRIGAGQGGRDDGGRVRTRRGKDGEGADEPPGESFVEQGPLDPRLEDEPHDRHRLLRRDGDLGPRLGESPLPDPRADAEALVEGPFSAAGGPEDDGDDFFGVEQLAQRDLGHLFSLFAAPPRPAFLQVAEMGREELEAQDRLRGGARPFRGERPEGGPELHGAEAQDVGLDAPGVHHPDRCCAPRPGGAGRVCAVLGHP